MDFEINKGLKPMSWKPEVQVVGEEGSWHGNALRFATKAEAEQNAKNLESRWMMVTKTRATESQDPVNYKWVDNRLEPIESAS